MKQFSTITSRFVPLPMENIDTDQIIPARFLKATTREGFGKNLFCDWRYDAAGNPKPEFILNNPAYSGEVLVAAKNFGCGSSREHAAWAIVDAGFKVVISSFFADIFKSNALNNGLLPVRISENFLQEIFQQNTKATLTINLQEQTITNNTTGASEHFDINIYKKTCMINGYDDIDYLLNIKPEIEAYENKRIGIA